ERLDYFHDPLVVHLLDPGVDWTGPLADERTNAGIGGGYVNLGPANRRGAVRRVAQAFGVQPTSSGTATEPAGQSRVGDDKARTGDDIPGRHGVLHQVGDRGDRMHIERR